MSPGTAQHWAPVELELCKLEHRAGGSGGTQMLTVGRRFPWMLGTQEGQERKLGIQAGTDCKGW